MGIPLTLREENQLKLVARGLKTNEKLQHDAAAVASLIEKGLLMGVGIGVRLTPKGKEELKAL